MRDDTPKPLNDTKDEWAEPKYIQQFDLLSLKLGLDGYQMDELRHLFRQTIQKEREAWEKEQPQSDEGIEKIFKEIGNSDTRSAKILLGRFGQEQYKAGGNEAYQSGWNDGKLYGEIIAKKAKADLIKSITEWIEKKWENQAGPMINKESLLLFLKGLK